MFYHDNNLQKGLKMSTGVCTCESCAAAERIISLRKMATEDGRYFTKAEENEIMSLCNFIIDKTGGNHV